MSEEYKKNIVENGIVVCIHTIYVLFFEERTFMYHYFIINSIDFWTYSRHTQNQLYTNLSYQNNCNKYL